MFMFYSDCSGTPQIEDNSKHYVMLGVSVHEKTWFALNNRVEGLKRKYSCQNESFELHCADIAVRIREQEQIDDFEKLNYLQRREKVEAIYKDKINKTTDKIQKEKTANKFKSYLPYLHLTRLERSKLIEDALDIVGDHNGITLFCEAIDKKHPSVINGTVSPLHIAFEQVISRFDSFLKRGYEKRNQDVGKNNKPILTDNGLIVFDKDYSTEKSMTDAFDQFRRKGHTYGELRHVIDIPFFATSHSLIGLQLADVCAYAVRRYLDKGIVKESFEETNFLRIANRFDVGKYDKLHGIRHYTKANECKCWICHRRGFNKDN